MNSALTWAGGAIARYLSKRSRSYAPPGTSTPELLARALRVADVLLIEGNTRISGVIKYLTQSTWSHAALYVGNVTGAGVKCSTLAAATRPGRSVQP